MGSGKTCVGSALAPLLKAWFVDLDDYIVFMEGRSIPEIFSTGGEAAFRKIELESLKALLGRQDKSRDMVIALGGGTIMIPEARELILKESTCVYLRCSFETIRRRLGERDATRPMFGKDAEELLQKRHPIYSQAHIIFDADDDNSPEVAKRLLPLLGK